MTSKRIIVLFVFFLACVCPTHAQMQEIDYSMNGERTTRFPVFKKLVSTPIPGGNILGQPVRIDGSRYEIRTEKHGLCYPVLFDWNRDGKVDLLMGEFETGEKGSNIKVFLNKGTNRKPRFTGEWFYATDINGDTLTCHQWCCIGTHPQVVDLDGDGYDDIISGQYNPGKISWWRGSEKGFLPRQFIDQEGYVEGKFYNGMMSWSPESNTYWNFTTARFADFNGDGLLDLFVAGSGGYRVALNKGTKEHPVLGLREYLFHVDGTILHTRREPNVVVETGKNFSPYQVCGDGHSYIFPYDWDHDGVLDLLVHEGYTRKGSEVIYFFRGVQTDDGLRFEHAVPLFTAEDGSKVLPGCAPMLSVVDYNQDGVEDILLGLSIATYNPEQDACTGGYEGATEVYWNWLDDLSLNFPGKDAGASLKYYGNNIDTIRAKMAVQPSMKDFFIGKLADMKYITLRHRGYPVVIYGKKNPVEAEPKIVKAAPREFFFDETHMYDVYTRKNTQKIVRQTLEKHQLQVSEDKPVDYLIVTPVELECGTKEFEVEVKFKVLKDYHVYNNSEVNSDQIPVTITFSYPEGILSKEGGLQEPKINEGIRVVYTGEKGEDGSETFIFRQTFRLKEGVRAENVDITVKVGYQTCSSKMCLPPVEEEKVVTVVFL